ncbi:MAG TPA: Rossmann-like and DUF2520 domain-containing protein [Pyrinomonadaceae bacterium]|jgi:predicted short-subunit dehydrogenase-like oxidoreductase (DUF2520 family)
MQTVSIIGIGRIGGALAVALESKDYRIENLIFKEQRKKAEIIREILKAKPRLFKITEADEIKSDIIFICTQDAEITSVAEILAAKLRHRPFVFHTSGALSSEILSGLKHNGCPIGSIHPLVSISDALLGAERFRGAYFCVEGETKAVGVAERIVTDLGGNAFSVETNYKTLYHAAAVTACGHLIALLDASFEMLKKCGLESEQAKRVLLPLVKSTIENLERQTPSAALTGTFARADAETFERHVATLIKNVSPEILEIYLLLGLRSLPLAEKQGAKPENINKMQNEIQKQLLLAKKNFK